MSNLALDAAKSLLLKTSSLTLRVSKCFKQNRGVVGPWLLHDLRELIVHVAKVGDRGLEQALHRWLKLASWCLMPVNVRSLATVRAFVESFEILTRNHQKETVSQTCPTCR